MMAGIAFTAQEAKRNSFHCSLQIMTKYKLWFIYNAQC